MRPVIVSNGGPYLQMRSVGSHSTSGGEEKVEKDKTGSLWLLLLLPAAHGAMGCGQKSFKLVWRCHQLLSGFLAKDHLPRVSRPLPRSLNEVSKFLIIYTLLFFSFTHLRNFRIILFSLNSITTNFMNTETNTGCKLLVFKSAVVCGLKNGGYMLLNKVLVNTIFF